MDKAHHSFTRAAYDDCELRKQCAENTAQFEWATDSNVVESQGSCFEATAPFMHNPFRSTPRDSIDIESELRGQTRNLSRCPEHKFDPLKAKTHTIDYTFCQLNLAPEYTRTNRSCNVLSGISINRFDPLCEDPTINIQSNSYIGSNTRLEIKDAFTQKREKEQKMLKGMDLKHLKDFCQVGNMQCAFVEKKN
jgi:hypothetical protein